MHIYIYIYIHTYIYIYRERDICTRISEPFCCGMLLCVLVCHDELGYVRIGWSMLGYARVCYVMTLPYVVLWCVALCQDGLSYVCYVMSCCAVLV